MSGPAPQPITDQGALNAFVDRLSQAPFLAVDTEFHRERTYWPILCLLQVSGPEVEGLVDPLADALDMTPLFDLLADPSRVKVFHAARQDQEIFFKLLGAPLSPVFDTQLAAMALGIGDSVSYDKLIGSVLDREIDKSSQFTDWRKRPLSDKQLHYALGDVTHLRDAYVLMRAQLEDQGRADWIAADNAQLSDRSLYHIEPDEAWQRMKIRKRRPEYVAVLKTLAEWRERLAQEENKPRNRILKDDAIYAIAEKLPRSPAKLSALKQVPKGFAGSDHGQHVLELLEYVIDNPAAFAPNLEPIKHGQPVDKHALDHLRMLLESVSEEAQIAPRLIANASDLKRLASGDTQDHPVLEGWRKDIFGERAIHLLNNLPDEPPASQTSEPAPTSSDVDGGLQR